MKCSSRSVTFRRRLTANMRIAAYSSTQRARRARRTEDQSVGSTRYVIPRRLESESAVMSACRRKSPIHQLRNQRVASLQVRRRRSGGRRGGDEGRHAVQERTHRRRQRRLDLRERAPEIGLERGAGEGFEERPAEIDGADFVEREAPLHHGGQRPALEAPAPAPRHHLVVPAENRRRRALRCPGGSCAS